MSASNFIIFILIVVVLALALWVRSLEKALDNIENVVINHMTWYEKQKALNNQMLKWYQNSQISHEEQGEINVRTLEWCKNTDKTLDNMLETQEKLTEMGNETYTKYLEVQAQINGIKFIMDTYCVADEEAHPEDYNKEEEE